MNIVNDNMANCIINRAEGVLKILKDLRKCEAPIMIELGYKQIEGLTGGMIKMLEREIKRAK